MLKLSSVIGGLMNRRPKLGLWVMQVLADDLENLPSHERSKVYDLLQRKLKELGWIGILQRPKLKDRVPKDLHRPVDGGKEQDLPVYENVGFGVRKPLP